MKKSSQGPIRYLQSNGAGGFSAIILAVIIVLIGGLSPKMSDGKDA